MRSRPLRRALLALESTLTLSTLYLLGLLLAARGAKRRSVAQGVPPDRNLRLVVLVPAHDEEAGITATLAALTGTAYPEAERRIVVIADNCGDRTAALAAAAGAEVWERTDPERRGKGHALAWALERLYALDDPFDAVVFVDADCIVSANLLAAVDARLRGGARALQVDYVAGNPEASSASALRFAAFAVGDTVRFLGKEQLGLSCGLVGTGMAFTRDLLERNPWTATGLVEDGEFHMRLVLAGLRLVGAPAHVYRALLSAPALIANKLGLYGKLLSGRGPTAWVRTEREPSPPPTPVGGRA